jgi:hypothetical protein
MGQGGRSMTSVLTIFGPQKHKQKNGIISNSKAPAQQRK